jgi:hypothetical protein
MESPALGTSAKLVAMWAAYQELRAYKNSLAALG